MLEAEVEERLSRLSVGFRTGLPLRTARLGFYQLGRGQLIPGEKNNCERTEDCESNQTATDFVVAPFALTQPRCPFSGTRDLTVRSADTLLTSVSSFKLLVWMKSSPQPELRAHQVVAE